MKNYFTNLKVVVILTAFIGFGLNSLADDSKYIEAEMSVEPLSGALSMFPYPSYDVQWKGVTLNKLDRTKITLSINGKPVTLSNQVSIATKQESDEQFGGTNIWDVSLLNMQFSKLVSGKYGEIKISVKEGAVTSTDGKINEEFELTYYQYELFSFEPKITSDTFFEEGSGKIIFEWKYNTKPIFINENTPYPPFADVYSDEGSVKEKKSLIPLMSVEDGRVTIDVSTLPAGAYSVTFPEGCIFFGEEGDRMINGEFYCDFWITEKPEEPVEEPEPGEDPEDDPTLDPDDDDPENQPGEIDPGTQPGEDESEDQPGEDNPNIGSDTDSVSSVSAADDGSYTVYNLQGVLLMSTNRWEELLTLPQGIYVINGKRIVMTTK